MAYYQKFDEEEEEDPYAPAIVSIGKALEKWTQCEMENWVTPLQYVDKLEDGVLILRALEKVVATKQAAQEEEKADGQNRHNASSSRTTSVKFPAKLDQNTSK